MRGISKVRVIVFIGCAHEEEYTTNPWLCDVARRHGATNNRRPPAYRCRDIDIVLAEQTQHVLDPSSTTTHRRDLRERSIVRTSESPMSDIPLATTDDRDLCTCLHRLDNDNQTAYSVLVFSSSRRSIDVLSLSCHIHVLCAWSQIKNKICVDLSLFSVDGVSLVSCARSFVDNLAVR